MVVIPAHFAMAPMSAPAFHYTPPGFSHGRLATYLVSAVECSRGNSSSEYLKLSLEKINVILIECLPLRERILKYIETTFIYDSRFENLKGISS